MSRPTVPLTCLLLAVTALSGCRTLGTYRVVDLREDPDEAGARVTRALVTRGYQVTSIRARGQRVTITAVKRHRATPSPPPRPPARKGISPRTGPPPRTGAPVARPVGPGPPVARPRPRAPDVVADLYPAKDGTRVLLHPGRGDHAPPLLHREGHRDHTVAFGLNGKRWLWEAHAEAGFRHAPGYGGGLAVEAGARLGYRVFRLGGGVDRPAPHVSVGLALGLGGGWSYLDELGYAMPSLTLSYLVRRAVEPIPGRVIPIGPEFGLDLHAVALLGTRRASLEGQLVFRYSDIVGFYVGVGHQWLPERGVTFTCGLYLSTIGAATAALFAALAAY